MSSPALPFLYQTRTIQRALRTQNALPLIRLAHMHVPRRTRPRKVDNAVPFEWDHDTPYEDDAGSAAAADKPSTITPSEAEIFKGIFDDIARGRMPPAAKRPAASSRSTPRSRPELGAQATGMARSIVEQARVMEFRDKFLRRYPPSLREAAQVALGLYELEPGPGGSGSSKIVDMDEADVTRWEERARHERLRTKERERVDALMKACETDAALWRVMEAEVFSLPARLGIARRAAKMNRAEEKRKAGERHQDSASAPKNPTSAATAAVDDKPSMDVHGPLYPHFLNRGLALFATAFGRPSDYAFAILPRVKMLGLPSYVLGVSAPFYTRLARMHWERFGDAAAALDVLQEMMCSAGLDADEGAHALLAKMRDHLHGCAWGAQGGFVMGMMEGGALMARVEGMEREVAAGGGFA